MNVTKRINKKPDEQEEPAPPDRESRQTDSSTNYDRNLSLSEPVKYLISAFLVLLGIGIAVGLGMLRESNAKVDSDALIPLVETAPVGNFQGNLDLVVSGTVVPFREIQVGPQVAGNIAKKYPVCEAGNFVKKGTPLIEIDPIDYQLEIKTVNSEILQAQRTIEETEQDIRGAMKNLEIAQTELKLQRNEYQRKLRLKNSLSPTEINEAKKNLLNSEAQATTRQNTYDSLLAKKQRLNASLALSETRLQRAELNLNRATVVAPVDGVIVRESVEEGNFAAVSNPLFVIEDTSQCEVACNLTPGELAWLRKYSGDDANSLENIGGVYDVPKVGIQIYEQNDTSIVWNGVLERFDGIGRNATTKSIPCRIVVSDPVSTDGSTSRVLVRGMFVKCRAILSTAQSLSLATLPLVAVRPGDYVWVVRDGRLKRIDVDVIDRSPIVTPGEDKMVAVDLSNGLTLEDLVVVSPLPQPIEGGKVLLKNDQATKVAENSEPESSQNTTELSNQTDEPNQTDAERSEP